MSEPDRAESAGVPRRRRAVQIGLGALAVVLLALAIHRERREILDSLGRLAPLDIMGAGGLVLVGLVANLLSWREVLAGLGSRLPVLAAARVFLVAQLGKYLPGSVWPVLAQVELARDHHVPRLRSGIAAIAALLVGMVAGAVVAVACLLPTSASERLSWGMIVVIPVGLALLHPAVLRRALMIVLRLTRRPTIGIPVDSGSLVRAVGWSLVMWAFLGAHVFVLARGVGASGVDVALVATGAYAAAWIAGLLVVVAPAGAGAREAALVVALGSVLDPGSALAVAIVSRFLTLVGDLVCGLVAVLATRSPRQAHEAVGATGEGATHQPPR